MRRLFIKHGYLFPLIISILVTLGILLLFNPVKSKFAINVRYLDNGGDECFNSSCDFEDDGTSEIIEIGFDSYDQQYIKVKDGETLFTTWQEKIDGGDKPLRFEAHTCYNLPGDSVKVITFLFHRNDTVFLGMMHGTKMRSLKFDTFPVVCFKGEHGIDNLRSGYIGIHYPSGIDNPQIIFVLNAGWDYQPRALFRYDPGKRELYQSPASGGIKRKPTLIDIHDDGTVEYFATSSAPNNFFGDTPYADSCIWIHIYNNDLTYYNEPVNIPGKGPRDTYTYSSYTDAHYIGINVRHSDTSSLYQYNHDKGELSLFKGDFIGEKYELSYSYDSCGRFLHLRKTKSRSPFLFDLQKNTVKEVKGDFASCFEIETFYSDALNDELIFYYNDIEKKIIAYTSDYKYHAETSCEFDKSYKTYGCFLDHERRKFMISSAEGTYIVGIDNMVIWKYRYLIWFAVFIGISGLVFGIWYLSQAQTRRRYEMKAALDKYKILAIHNQLNPHFVFNTLNTLANTIYLEDKSKAHNYFGNFGKLLRITINSSGKIERTLNEEIEFVRNYLDLQVLRFQDKFTFEINVSDEVDRISDRVDIPGLIIHTFVENAVKHGFYDDVFSAGNISINVEKSSKCVIISITDNGIGFKGSANKNHAGSNGKGLKLLQEKIDLFNEIHDTSVRYSLEEKNPGNITNPGTQVQIFLSN